ncbi:hypothetical protein ElyMa_000239900 [Elysia marginata]|uniref:Uncharacterized protein n=1 Tax=Elysia marginata TaxID=1093978 RepID=A0AAV4F0K1_9GAST|nr:hypothetical protein ElyMa_000239900 [Elysia marginata]
MSFHFFVCCRTERIQTPFHWYNAGCISCCSCLFSFPKIYNFCLEAGCIKSGSGQILMDIDDILKRWSQYVEELFDDVRGPRPQILNNEGPTIMEEEVGNAI